MIIVVVEVGDDGGEGGELRGWKWCGVRGGKYRTWLALSPVPNHLRPSPPTPVHLQVTSTTTNPTLSLPLRSPPVAVTSPNLLPALLFLQLSRTPPSTPHFFASTPCISRLHIFPRPLPPVTVTYSHLTFCILLHSYSHSFLYSLLLSPSSPLFPLFTGC